MCVVAIDAKKMADGSWQSLVVVAVRIQVGTSSNGQEVVALGVGENLFLTSMDKDGTKSGFDLKY